jgi:hypothetical protein
MPQPRKYDTTADKQRAYRERQAATRAQELLTKGLPPLPAIPTMPGERRWSLMQKQARETLQAMHEEMQGYHEERTEDWQESEKGEALQARMDALESIIADLDALTEA